MKISQACCLVCGSAFSYEQLGRKTRWKCDACKTATHKAARRRKWLRVRERVLAEQREERRLYPEVHRIKRQMKRANAAARMEVHQ